MSPATPDSHCRRPVRSFRPTTRKSRTRARPRLTAADASLYCERGTASNREVNALPLLSALGSASRALHAASRGDILKVPPAKVSRVATPSPCAYHGICGGSEKIACGVPSECGWSGCRRHELRRVFPGRVLPTHLSSKRRRSGWRPPRALQLHPSFVVLPRTDF